MQAFEALKAQALAAWEARTASPRVQVRVCMSSSDMHSGAAAALAAIQDTVTRLGLDADIGTLGSAGMCWAEPIVVVTRPGEPAITYGPVTAAVAPQFIEDVLATGDRRGDLALGVDGAQALDTISPFSELPYFQVQRRRLLERCGVIDPENIDDYIATGGYEGLDKALAMTPEDIVKLLTDANLTGRGGANFPAGRKWDFLRGARGPQKYMVCNADEGDPGAFVNRILLESDPHLVIEGMIIGGYVAGADYGYIYIRDEYPHSVAQVEHALQQARAKGLLGANVLGSEFSYDMQVVRGAGAYVCGEETGLIASIQDYRGMPRIKPPFPAQAGVFLKPTNVNNVETYACVPGIMINGIDWFTSVGTERNKGTKLFSLSGRLNRLCIIEVDVGTPMRTLLEVCGGGVPEGHSLKGIQQGGPLGGILPPDWLDTPLDPANFASDGTIMGSGGLIFLDDRDCIVDMCKWLLTFDQDESCGRCTTCRIGSMRMVDILDRMTKGTSVPQDLQILQHLEGVMQNANCVHGQFTPKPFNTAYKWFKEEFEAHLLEHRCPSGACRAMVRFTIDQTQATGVTVEALVASCPVDAIVPEGGSAVIVQDKCVRCGLCVQAAPNAVSVAPVETYSAPRREIRYA